MDRHFTQTAERNDMLRQRRKGLADETTEKRDTK